MERDSHLLELCRYVVLNPVRAGLADQAEDWPWSSYRATAGQRKGIDCLNVDWIQSAFAKRKTIAIKRYKKFVQEGKGQSSPWEPLRNQVYLGSYRFVDTMLSLLDGGKDLSEVPLAQRRPPPKTLSEYEATSQDRNTAIANAYRSGGYTLKVIGEYFRLHYSTVSGIVKYHKSKT